MDLWWFLISVISTLVGALLIHHFFRIETSQIQREATADKPSHPDLLQTLPEPILLLKNRLAEALPGCVISASETATFTQAINAYWAQQECEVVPACVVQPHRAQELSQAVIILKNGFDQFRRESTSTNSHANGLFAVRGGGHSPVAGAASIANGVLIDLGRFNEVTPSPDGTSVRIGAGCRWINVTQVLEKKGLAVAGGRNSAVGVGGLTLGGGLSFLSPRCGFVCSNIIEYEVVLADGSLVVASSINNPDLWRALKGGSNNFGIVTSFTARSFPLPQIWAGFLYIPSFEASNVLSAFHDFLNRTVTNDVGQTYNEHAGGPLTSFTYLHQLGIQAIVINLVHTQAPTIGRKWPACWQNSKFASLWRFWSTCKLRSLTDATDELSALDPPGQRQLFATTTIKNDPATLQAAHDAFRKSIVSIRKRNIKGMSWSLVLQPLIPEWARKGDPNSLGLDTCDDEPLVVVGFMVHWTLRQDDVSAETITRCAIEQIETFATAHGTNHRYRYLNYCGKWQKPFDGYGEENLTFLKQVSRKYDPDGLFQIGCSGGFKLGL
ncbi:FAD-binding domain-containing protein [Dothidotthia symphoricarpi CBS 119687]|uniref:FAD-binding domain-containing protein n=1 Tax=Dothidotthia symphoricarpi CBS 119687 TaxID=1392245 RepID=A0A6A6AFX8_9PLEO|nr:FAD-binding domain-containing protein [Dothidotthia symphoricarpi CBS 119687]KAF2130183.1 FAD-binding domain-containing protein [Dothidotthia symphoricarpi CBS 119687]